MSTDFGKRIKAARKCAGLTQKELAGKINLAQPSLSHLENAGFASVFTAQIADACGVNPHWLATGEGEMLPAGGRVELSNVTPAPIGTRRVPLISYVQAGCWTEATDPATVGDGFEYLLTDLDLSGSAFALQIEGESMLPQFKPGDRVIVDPEICPQPGDFVVAMNGGHEATFKKYRPRSMDEAGNVVFELVPLNEDFAPMRSDQTPIRIVGTMMEHRQYRRRP